ncbi:PAS domain S-box protein [Arcicella aquatica]|uniref:histidine kinase n=1 Tax=Arcicella aquatica TaxID=217141 RepID=A0ABU5QJY0_9BACT|nr:PAS domain S-box protein [Arcicella aquatica]MEA5257372.1 PAS domain S-box protein [Arcicella aquatica]
MNNFTPPNEFITIQVEALQENGFDFVLDVASNIFDSSVICLSFVGTKRQWCKSAESIQLSLDLHLSTFLIRHEWGYSKEIFTINNPQEAWLLAQGIKSISGMTLYLTSGMMLGHIVLLHHTSVELTEKEQKIFKTFAKKTIELIEQNQLSLNELLFEKNQLKVLLSATNEYIWCVDRNLNLISANKTYIDAIKKYTGNTLKVGESFLLKNFYTEELIQLFKTQSQKAFLGNTFSVDVYMPPTEWYNEQWMDITFHPIYENGKIEKLVLNARNITKRKKDKDKIKKSKEQYRLLFLSNPQPMWIYDVETLAFLEINKAAIQHYGYAREEFLKMTLLDIRPKEDAYKFLDYTNDDNEFKANQYEWRHIKKNGEIIYVMISTHGIRYQGRRAKHVLINDITEQKRYLQLLETEKANTLALINSTDDLVWSIDKNECLVTANEAYLQLIERIYGVRLKTGDYVNKIIGIDEHTKLKWQTFHQKVLQGNTFTYELFSPEFDTFWATWSEIIFNPIKEGDTIRGAAMFGRNITKRKIAELELQANERTLLETSQIGKIGGWQFDIVTKKVTWNAITKEIHEAPIDYEPTFETGLMAYKEGQDRDKIIQAVNEAILYGKPYDHEVQIITEKGKTRWVRTKGRVELVEGKPIRLYGMMQDINDQKKHLGEIETQNKQLREIAWMQSHIVRAPVARIMGIINLLNDFDNIEISREELLQNILDSAYELDGIIRKINNTIKTDHNNILI